MSIIRQLQVQHVRIHQAIKVDLSPQVTLITGLNGSGKTSLIEAVYLAFQGSSFKGADSDMLQRGETWWRIDMLLADDAARTVKFDSERTTGRKQFTVDSKTMYRLAPRYKYPVVLFEPEDLRLLHGSPTRRRQFIDRFISQLDPLYGPALRKYDRALKQRNNLLKKYNPSSDELFVWDVALAEHGAYIIEQRIQFIERINQELNDGYQAIAHSADVVSVHYSHTLVGNIKQKLLGELHGRSERDKLLGYTSVGPHRHDVLFIFNSTPALSSASRGEIRSIVLALKFLEISIIKQITNQTPVVLLDDVFSELDETRQKALTQNDLGAQIIIATTNSHNNYTSLPSVAHILLGE